MKSFLGLPEQDKHDAFLAASNQLGLPAFVIEKDFHVTVVLKLLFGPIRKKLVERRLGSPYVFKGGTTLSKVYGVIDRMSEDIDLALNMVFLGYPEPEGENRSQRDKRLKQLTQAAKDFTQNELL